MNYELTQHAQDVLARRKIPIEWVERVISSSELVHPDQTDAELEHRLARIPEFGNRVLRVILNRMTNPEKIITFYFDRTMRDRL